MNYILKKKIKVQYVKNWKWNEVLEILLTENRNN